MADAPNWFMFFIFFWTFVMVGAMGVGGFFMFRKFLKIMPQRDGKSKLDWQNYWVERSRHLWTDESKAFLQELVEPVPTPFRDIAAHSIAARIGQEAIETGAEKVTKDICIVGYIKATPKRDYKVLISFLKKKGIDYKPYEHIFNR